jgi:NYN domain
MEPLRTVIYVDGRNFKHNLRDFKFQAPGDNRVYHLDEKHFKWREFFLGILATFDRATGHSHRLVRVYWCNADSIRPFEININAVRRILSAHRGDFPNMTEQELIGLARAWYDRERDHFQQTRERVFEHIQRRVNFLEFRYVGEYVVKPFEPFMFEPRLNGQTLYLGTREGEKGVDVGIAVDMIAKLNEYDAAVLVSGDADFIPLVQHLKDKLRLVYQFSLARGIPPRINYLSPWLIGRVDCFQAFNELELLHEYLDRTAGIPSPILSQIDAQIAGLRAIAPQA